MDPRHSLAEHVARHAGRPVRPLFGRERIGKTTFALSLLAEAVVEQGRRTAYLDISGGSAGGGRATDSVISPDLQAMLGSQRLPEAIKAVRAQDWPDVVVVSAAQSLAASLRGLLAGGRAVTIIVDHVDGPGAGAYESLVLPRLAELAAAVRDSDGRLHAVPVGSDLNLLHSMTVAGGPFHGESEPVREVTCLTQQSMPNLLRLAGQPAGQDLAVYRAAFGAFRRLGCRPADLVATVAVTARQERESGGRAPWLATMESISHDIEARRQAEIHAIWRGLTLLQKAVVGFVADAGMPPREDQMRWIVRGVGGTPVSYAQFLEAFETLRKPDDKGRVLIRQYGDHLWGLPSWALQEFVQLKGPWAPHLLAANPEQDLNSGWKPSAMGGLDNLPPQGA